jgi:hypothetical protein
MGTAVDGPGAKRPGRDGNIHVPRVPRQRAALHETTKQNTKRTQSVPAEGPLPWTGILHAAGVGALPRVFTSAKEAS